MEPRNNNNKLKKQVERLIFIAGFQQLLKFITPEPKSEEESALINTFLIAAIQDATDAGIAGEA